MTDLLSAEVKKPSGSEQLMQKLRHYLDHIAGGLVLLNLGGPAFQLL